MIGYALVLAAAALAAAAIVGGGSGPKRSDSGARRRSERRRAPTAVQAGLAVIAAGVAIAAVVAAVGASRDVGSHLFLVDGPLGGGPAPVAYAARAAPTATATPTPSPTPTPLPSLALSPHYMPLPVDGAWRVTCGYRCGLHDEEHTATFALDIVRSGGATAGQPVFSPVEGRIMAVEDSSPFFCRGKMIEGPEGGAVVLIDFKSPAGETQRARLAHLDVESVADELRPAGRPVAVGAGEFLGTVADLGRCSHLHLSLTLLDGREEVPQPMAIEGAPLEDCGAEDCWQGTLLPIQES